MFFDEAAPLTPYVAVEHGGQVLFVQTSDLLLGKQVFCNGRWNDDETLDAAVDLLEQHGLVIREGRTFVDVGANIGTTTVHALRRLGFSEAVAIEPSADNSRTLRINLAANDLEDRVQVVAAAASDREGPLPLRLSKRSSGRHMTLGGLEGLEGTDTVETVQGITLDDLVARGLISPEKTGLVWIDAAGSETRVMGGASGLREQGIPLVTAVRPKLGNWKGVRAALVDLLAPHYSHFVDLRAMKKRAVADLRSILDDPSIGSTDLLAFRSQSGALAPSGSRMDRGGDRASLRSVVRRGRRSRPTL